MIFTCRELVIDLKPDEVPHIHFSVSAVAQLQGVSDARLSTDPDAMIRINVAFLEAEECPTDVTRELFLFRPNDDMKPWMEHGKYDFEQIMDLKLSAGWFFLFWRKCVTRIHLPKIT